MRTNVIIFTPSMDSQKDILENDLKNRCPKCGEGNFVRKIQPAKGWKKIQSLLLSLTSGTHPKHDTYKLVCTKCRTENVW